MTTRTLETASRPLDRPARLAAAVGLALAPLLGMIVADAPAAALIGVVGLAVAAMLLGRPHWAAYAVCLTMLSPHLNLRTGVAVFTLGDLTGVLLVVVWLAQAMAGGRRPRLMPGWWLVIGILAWMAAGLALSPTPGITAGRYLRQVLMSVSCLALMDVLADTARLRTATWLVCFAGLSEAVYAIPEFGTVYRVGGAVEQPNLFGNVVGMAAICAFALLTQARRPAVRIFLIGAMGLMLLAVILSISRGTYLALGVALVWWMKHNRRALLLVLLLGGVAAGFTTWRAARQEEIAERLEMADDSVQRRLQTLRNGVLAIQANPFFGVGYGQFGRLDKLVEVTSDAGRAAHNFYLSMAASNGIPALLMYLCFVGLILRRLQRLQARPPTEGAPMPRDTRTVLIKGAQASLIYILVASLTKGMAMPLWGQLGLCAAATQLPEAEPSEPT